MMLSGFLVRDAIITDLRATTTETAIREIVLSVQRAGYLGAVNAEGLTRAFLNREELGSTGIGKGIACPHGGHPAVDRVFGTIALSSSGVAFKACDGKPVHLIFLLFHTPEQFARKPITPGDIYDAFKAIARLTEEDDLLDRLRQCRTRETVLEVIAEFDRKIAETEGVPGVKLEVRDHGPHPGCLPDR